MTSRTQWPCVAVAAPMEPFSNAIRCEQRINSMFAKIYDESDDALLSSIFLIHKMQRKENVIE